MARMQSLIALIAATMLLGLMLLVAVPSSLRGTRITSTMTVTDFDHNHLRQPSPPQHDDGQPHHRQRQLTTMETRIVGGRPVAPGRHPYFAQWDGAQCGATVIHDDIAVSAAHCYDSRRPPASRQLLLDSIQRNAGISRRYVEVIPHPNYNGPGYDRDGNNGNLEYDIVLIRTVTSMLVDEQGKPTGVVPLAINTKSQVPAVEDPVWAVGFGQTDETNVNTLSDELRDVKLYHVDDDVCASQYYETGHFNPYVMFCTGVPGGGKDTCQGDSGGPIVDFKTNTLVGVVSFGEGCAREDYAGVNARISAVADWIEQQICELSNFPPNTCPSKTPPISYAQEPVSGSNGGTGTDVYIDGSSSTGNSAPGTPPPMYNPRGDGTPIQMYNPHDDTAKANVYPGNGPKVPTNAVTINVKYQFNSQYVTWTLEQEAGEDLWEPYFRSPRGNDNMLQSQTFHNMRPGWWRFHLKDPQAESRIGRNDYALQWMSIMAPRGSFVWGKQDEFRQSAYTVYFEINQVGIVSAVEGEGTKRRRT